MGRPVVAGEDLIPILEHVDAVSPGASIEIRIVGVRAIPNLRHADAIEDRWVRGIGPVMLVDPNLVPWHILASERGVRLEFIPVTEDGLLVYESSGRADPPDFPGLEQRTSRKYGSARLTLYDR